MKKLAYFLLASCVALPAVAGFTEGEEAFNQQHYLQAYNEFLPLADKDNDYRAQYYIGYLYLYGYGVQKDESKALKYLNLAAEQGDSMALAQLGYMYFNGQGVEKDQKKGLKLYQQAADDGNPSALLNLGVAYYTGDGVSKNVERAIEYFSQISLEDKPVVAKYLGNIYLNEKQFADPKKAFDYYTIAAANRDIGAYYVLGYMYHNGLGISQSTQNAVSFYLYAASKGYPQAQYALGVMNNNGDGMPQNRAKAHGWFSLAAAKDFEPAIEAQKTLEASMSQSEMDKARRAVIEIQQVDFKNAKNPALKEVSTASKSVSKDKTQSKRRNTVRRVSRR